eukprot:38253-Amphidinium_carterae.1
MQALINNETSSEYFGQDLLSLRCHRPHRCQHGLNIHVLSPLVITPVLPGLPPKDCSQEHAQTVSPLLQWHVIGPHV